MLELPFKPQRQKANDNLFDHDIPRARLYFHRYSAATDFATDFLLSD